LGVRAQIFDPKDPKDIAAKLEYILQNEEQAKADALISQENINRYKWTDVAEKYWNVFEQTVRRVN
jgi:glycosyltransferase involved in cell wall biosynthesis